MQPPLPRVLVAALATVLFGAALGLAPYTWISIRNPGLNLWDPTDGITVGWIAIQAVGGVFVLEVALIPLFRPLWRKW